MNTLLSLAKKLYKVWIKFAHILAIVNTTLLLTIVYIFLIGIASIFIWLVKKDLLKHRLNISGTFWKPKEVVVHTLEQTRHQF
jgi:hypothetical protein